MIDTSNSIFWKEIFEQPEAVANCLAANREVCKQIAAEVKERNIKTVVLVGRGSSDHANLVGRYLFEAKCGMVTSISAPSVVTAYKSAPDYSNVLMIAVSQSGGAQDIYEVMKACDEQGGICVSVTNVEGSLMTQVGKYKINNHCGPENSVTAGKSYMTQVMVLTMIAAYISEDSELLHIGTRIPSHVDRLLTPGIDVTCGSLGQGASVAAGIAYGLKHAGITDQYVYVCIGDGELNEGQNWEAFQFMAHNKLNNCIVFIDNNKRQHDGYCDEVLKPFSYEEKMKAFGFWCKTVDGASEEAIDDGINEAKAVKDQAVCIVLDTIKGQGVKYYEEMPDNHAPKVFEEGRAVIDAAILELRKITEEE